MIVNEAMKNSIQNKGCRRGCLILCVLVVLAVGVDFWLFWVRTEQELHESRGLITHGNETPAEFVNRVTGWTKEDRYVVDITALQPIVGYKNHAVLFEATPEEIASLVERLGMEKHQSSRSTDPSGILTGGFFLDEKIKLCKHGEAYFQAEWDLYERNISREEAGQLIPLSGAGGEKGYVLWLLYSETLSTAILNVGDWYTPLR